MKKKIKSLELSDKERKSFETDLKSLKEWAGVLCEDLPSLTTENCGALIATTQRIWGLSYSLHGRFTRCKQMMEIGEVAKEIGDEWIPLIYDWVKYRRADNEKFGNDMTIRAFYGNLTKITKGNVEVAKKKIDEAIRRGWSDVDFSSPEI